MRLGNQHHKVSSSGSFFSAKWEQSFPVTTPGRTHYCAMTWGEKLFVVSIAQDGDMCLWIAVLHEMGNQHHWWNNQLDFMCGACQAKMAVSNDKFDW